MAAKVTIYADPLSQPARSLIIFCRAAGVPHDVCTVSIGKGEHMKPDYCKLNPQGKIPCMKDGDFSLGDSSAIMSYLCATRQVADHWHPREPRARAAVDSVLGWHGNMLRTGAATLIFNRVLGRGLGAPVSEEVCTAFALPRLKQSLKLMETAFLGTVPGAPPPTGWVARGADISIADLLLACELDEAVLLDAAAVAPNYDQLLAPYPNVREWMARVAARVAPYWDEERAMLSKFRGVLLRRKAKM